MRRLVLVILLAGSTSPAAAAPFARLFGGAPRGQVRAAIRNARAIKSGEARDQLLENSAQRLVKDLTPRQLAKLVREMATREAQDRAVRTFISARGPELSVDEVLRLAGEIVSVYSPEYHRAVADTRDLAQRAASKEEALAFLGYVRHPGYQDVADARAFVRRNAQTLADQKSAVDGATDQLRDSVLISYLEMRGGLGAADLLRLAKGARLASTRQFFEERAAQAAR